MYALIIADTVHELFAEEPVLHPDLRVVDVSAVAGIAVGWATADGGKTWAAPEPLQNIAPSARSATTYQLFGAFTDAQRAAYPGPIKAWDQRLFSARDTPWPENNPKIARIADALGMTAKAWFDAALKSG